MAESVVISMLRAILNYKKTIIVLGVLAILGIIFCFYQYFYLKNAHATFENYYIFRGCTELVEKTNDYGICKLGNGHVIKIVKFDNRWFLDGDLPCSFLCF